MEKQSIYPCPICQQPMTIIGLNNKNKKIASCGHVFSFRKTKSAKMLDRKYIQTPFGLELRK